MSTFAAVHGTVARVVDVPSQGISYLRIEIPIEHHVPATQQFYGRDVLVTIAGPDMSGQPYGVMLAAVAGPLDPGPQPPAPPPAPPAPAPAPTTTAAQRRTKHALDAVLVCKDESFKRFICEAEQLDACSDNDAAEFVRMRCMVESRSELDTDPTAFRLFQQLMADFREWKE